MTYLDPEFKDLRLDQVEELNNQIPERVSKLKTFAHSPLTPRDYQYEFLKTL